MYMTREQIINLLIRKNIEISNKFATSIEEILRNKDSKTEIEDLKDSVEYTMDDIIRIISRK